MEQTTQEVRGHNTGSAVKARRPRRMAREPEPAMTAAAVTAAARSPNKIEQVLALLRRDEGATLAEMIEATGWLPHTTRAALTGLRKKGHDLAKTKRGDVTCYRIAEAG